MGWDEIVHPKFWAGYAGMGWDGIVHQSSGQNKLGWDGMRWDSTHCTAPDGVRSCAVFPRFILRVLQSGCVVLG